MKHLLTYSAALLAVLVSVMVLVTACGSAGGNFDAS